MECCAGSTGSEVWVAPERPSTSWWLRLGAAGLISVNAMAVTLAVNTSPMPASTRAVLQLVLVAAAATVAALVGGPLLRRVASSLRRRELGFELLFVSGILGAAGLSALGVARGAADGLYLEVVCLLLVIHALGDTLSAAGRRNALLRVRAIVGERGAVARVELASGATAQVARQQVAAGAVVVVHPGEEIPFDGVTCGGPAFVQTSALTGEPMARVVRAGDEVFAGWAVEDVTLRVRVAAGMGARLRDRAHRALEAALGRPSRTRRVADQVTRVFLPFVLVSASAVFGAWALAADLGTATENALAVLLVACPCAMGFALPLGAWIGLGDAAEQGFVPRSGEAFEALAEVDTLIFDKTGTLTDGRAGLVDLVTSSRSNRERLIEMLDAVARSTPHPLGRAFLRPGPCRWTARDVRVRPGLGVEARLTSPRGGEGHVELGRVEMLPEALRPDFEGLSRKLRASPDAHRVAVVVDGAVAGVAALDERARPGVRAALAELSALGVRCELATGDRGPRAERLEGFEQRHAGLSPEAKTELVRRLRREGRKVGFVGDGLNDAAALAESDVGVAVASGAELATTAADIVWGGADPRSLPEMVRRARRVREVARSNLRYAALYNTLGIAAAAAGLVHPVFAALLMVASSLFVTLRTTLLLEPEAPPVAVAAPHPS